MLGFFLAFAGLILIQSGARAEERTDEQRAAYDLRVSQLEPGAALPDPPLPDTGFEELPGAVLLIVGGCQIVISLVAMGVMVAHRERDWLSESAPVGDVLH